MALNAPVNANVVGNNTVVAAVAGKKIRVKSYELTLGAGTPPCTCQFQSGAGGTNLSGVFTANAIGAPLDAAAPMGDFLFETAPGALLNLATTGTGAVFGGTVEYTLE